MVEIQIIKCPFCYSEFVTNDMSKDYSYTCGSCGLHFSIQCFNTEKIKSKDLVIWIENNKVVTWKPQRTPALGWNTLTLLEALTDSAKTSLAIGNIERAKQQLNNLLKILRNKITFAKKKYRPLIQRCEFMENNRTRCNRTPVVEIRNGIPLCKMHLKKTKQETITLSNFMEVEL